MSVQEAINVWGRAKLVAAGLTPDPAADVTLIEDLPSASFCETCGPDPITINIYAQSGCSTSVYMSMGEAIDEMLKQEREGTGA